jgi:cytochrome c553
MKKAIVATLLVVVPVLMLASVANAEHTYIGTKNCKKCHIKQWKSWSETKMANAFETLKPGVAAERKAELELDPEKDYTTDPECVRCHVTGYGKEGGFTSIEETPELAGVGCEVCHGPGGTYTQDGYMTLKNKEFKRADIVAVGLIHPIGEAVCTQCHNEENPIPDYTFDYEAMKATGLHESTPLKYNHD